MRRPPALDHLVALSDEVGIIQHALDDIPNRETGYCTDDVSRAFMVAIVASEHDSLHEQALKLARVYLAFLHHAQLPDGRFHNFMSYERTWLDEVGTQDSIGRAVWGLGYGMRCAPRPSWRKICGQLIDRALPHVGGLDFVRSRAYAGIGLTHAYEALGRKDARIAAALREIAADLTARLDAASGSDWKWFEDAMTYDNARLPEALMRIGSVLGDRTTVEAGLAALEFYEKVVICDGLFLPIGNAGWYVRKGPRALYGQQPLEAASMVDAELVALAITGDPAHRQTAEVALDWYFGRNSRGIPMAAAGGCRDGLEADGANANMGAESTLAYLASALAFAVPAAEIATPRRRDRPRRISLGDDS